MNLTLNIPFSSLASSVKKMDSNEKIKLFEILEKEIAQTDEDFLAKNSEIEKELTVARKAYKNGDYVTIEEMLTQEKFE